MKTNTLETITEQALDTVTGGRGKLLTSLLGPDATTAWNQYYQSGGKLRSFDSAERIMRKPLSWL